MNIHPRNTAFRDLKQKQGSFESNESVYQSVHCRVIAQRELKQSEANVIKINRVQIKIKRLRSVWK